MKTRLLIAVLSVLIVGTAFVFLIPDSVEELQPERTGDYLIQPEDQISRRTETKGEEPDSQATTSENSSGGEADDAVQYGQSIYNFDLDYQQKAQLAAEAYLAPWGADAVLRWRPLHVDPNAILLAGYMQPNAMPEKLTFSPFEDMVFEAVRTDYQIHGHIESANWKGRLIGAHIGRVELAIVGGESNPSFVLKILSGSDDQLMVYSIVPTFESDVYVAIEGNPYQSLQID
jgi:hypothetical protein